MPWGVPTGRLNGVLDDSTPPMPQPDLQAPPLGIMGSAAPQANISTALQSALAKPKHNWMGILADALSGAAGATPLYGQSIMRQRQQDHEEQVYQNRLRLQQDYESRKPFHTQDADGNIVQVDPASGKGTILYHGAPKLSGIAAEIRDLRSAGATDEQIKAFVANKVDPVHMAATTDTTTGQTTLTPYRSSSLGTPAGGPPRVLKALPPGAVPLNDGGPTPAGSGTFPRPGLTIERNNNPGALRVPGSQSFQHFSDPQQGVQAQESLLQRRYLGKGLNTVSSIVETYAPRQSHGGDNTDAQVTNYTNYVARRLGINPNQPIDPSAVPRLAAAMREFETGRRGS